MVKNPFQTTWAVESAQHRDGFRLISTRRAALPVWKLALKCRVLETRVVETFEEFVLRAVALGIGDEEALADFLNLPQEVIGGVISDLLTNRHLSVLGGGDSPSLALSASGRDLVKTLVETRAVEKVLTYWVSGLSGEPISVVSSDLLSSADLDSVPRLIFEPDDEIDTDLSPDDTDRFLGAQPMKRDPNTSLLTVIETESASKQFVEVGALLFESESDESDLYLRLLVDGRSSEELEQLVRDTGVFEGLRLPSRILEDRRRVDRSLSSGLLSARVEDLLVEGLLADIEKANAVAPEGAESEDKADPRDAILAELGAMTVRRYGVGEALPALDAEIAAARGAVLFSTSRLWPAEERRSFHQKIDRLLKSGVLVTFECLSDHMAKVDLRELELLEEAFSDRGLAITPTKPDGEANFVSIDGFVLFVYASNPFTGLGVANSRLGDDRPTVIRGEAEVAAFLAHVHGVNASTSESRSATVDVVTAKLRTS